jgi:hypothetical protein
VPGELTCLPSKKISKPQKSYSIETTCTTYVYKLVFALHAATYRCSIPLAAKKNTYHVRRSKKGNGNATANAGVDTTNGSNNSASLALGVFAFLIIGRVQRYESPAHPLTNLEQQAHAQTGVHHQ